MNGGEGLGQDSVHGTDAITIKHVEHVRFE